MKSGNVLLGVLAGAAVGAVIGILYAPDRGSRTRKKILNKGDDFVHDMKEKFSDLLENMTEKYEAAKHATTDFVTKGKKTLEAAKQDGNNLPA